MLCTVCSSLRAQYPRICPLFYFIAFSLFNSGFCPQCSTSIIWAPAASRFHHVALSSLSPCFSHLTLLSASVFLRISWLLLHHINPFSSHLPSCLFFWSLPPLVFCFQIPQGPVLGPLPSFLWPLFLQHVISSLRCPVCVSAVSHCVRDRYAVTDSFVAEWTTGWGPWRGSIYSCRGS